MRLITATAVVLQALFLAQGTAAPTSDGEILEIFDEQASGSLTVTKVYPRGPASSEIGVLTRRAPDTSEIGVLNRRAPVTSSIGEEAVSVNAESSIQDIDIDAGASGQISDTLVEGYVLNTRDLEDLEYIDILNEDPSAAAKGTEVSDHDLSKRSFYATLKYDTGSVYRATYLGKRILIHACFDLAYNMAVFYFTAEPGYPAPASIKVGWRDITENIRLKPYRLAPGERFAMRGFKAGDTFTVFQG